MPKQSEDRINGILAAALQCLSKKGYDNTTIYDIADRAGISRGLLHYYFEDKEDLVAKALAFGFGPMWDSSTGSLKDARSAAELADRMIETLKRNVQENPNLTALLIEVWVSGRRSSKIWKVFNEGFVEAIDRLRLLLEFASSAGIINIKQGESVGIIRILLAMYQGLAIQLISEPAKIDDKQFWVPIRRILLSALEGNGA